VWVPRFWWDSTSKRVAPDDGGTAGILKAGGAYVPLDPAYPKSRLTFMLGDSRAPVLITQQHLAEAAGAAARGGRLSGSGAGGDLRGERGKSEQRYRADQPGVRDLHLRIHGRPRACGGPPGLCRSRTPGCRARYRCSDLPRSPANRRLLQIQTDDHHVLRHQPLRQVLLGDQDWRARIAEHEGEP